MSVKMCCVPNCNKSRAENFILHFFPNPDKDLERFNIWKNAVGGHIMDLDSKTIFELRRVCHNHFDTPYHTRSKRLSPNAIPTLHLSAMSEKERRRKCFKCGCSPAVDNVKLFRFPKPAKKNILRCELWAKFMHPDKDYHSVDLLLQLHSEHRMLCQKHFKDKDFTDSTKQLLLFDTAPSIDTANTNFDNAAFAHNFRDHLYHLDSPHLRDHIYCLNTKFTLTSDVQLAEHTVTLITPTEEKALTYNAPHGDDYDNAQEKALSYNAPNDDSLAIDNNKSLGINDDEALDSIEADILETAVYDDEIVLVDVDEVISDTENDVVIPAQSRDIQNEQHYDPKVHEGYSCNMCAGPIVGFRYRCIQCSDWDMCGTCEAKHSHSAHYVLRVPAPKPFAEVQAVVEQIRRALEMIANDPLYSGTFQQPDSVPLETDDIKSEDLTEDWDNLNLTSGTENFISCDRVSIEDLVPTIDDLDCSTENHDDNTENHDKIAENHDDDTVYYVDNSQNHYYNIENLDDILNLEDNTEYCAVINSAPASYQLVPAAQDIPTVPDPVQDYMAVTDCTHGPDRGRKRQHSNLTGNSNKIQRTCVNKSVIGDNAKVKGPSLPNVDNFQSRVVIKKLDIPKTVFSIKPSNIYIENKFKRIKP